MERTTTSRRTRGRPTKYTPDIGQRIARELTKGNSVRQIARNIGNIAPSTIDGWLRNDDHHLHTYREGRSDG